MKSHTLLNKRIMAYAQKFGLTAGQPKILEYLSVVDSADQTSIAKYCEIEPATVGSILSRMEDNGLILRQREGTNRRSLYVSLTQKGREASKKTTDLFELAEQKAFEGISEDTQKKLCDTLQLIYDNLQNTEDLNDKTN